MIHITKGKSVSLAQLKKIKLIRPKAARGYWQGIQHGDLVQAITKECGRRNWVIGETKFTTDQAGASLAGVMELVSIPELKAPIGMSFQLGFLTSNNLRRGLRLVAGAQVAICHNGMTSGEILLHHRHTKDFNFEEAISEGLDQYDLHAHKLGNQVSQLKETTLDDSVVDSILCQAGRAKLMPWSRLGEVDKEYRHPTYDYGAKLNSCWGLLNAFTVVVKKNPPQQQMQQMEGFRLLLPCGK